MPKANLDRYLEMVYHPENFAPDSELKALERRQGDRRKEIEADDNITGFVNFH